MDEWKQIKPIKQAYMTQRASNEHNTTTATGPIASQSKQFLPSTGRGHAPVFNERAAAQLILVAGRIGYVGEQRSRHCRV